MTATTPDGPTPPTDPSAPGAPGGPGAPGEEILRCEHISKSYGVVTALTDVNLRLRRGEVLGLIGDNGAGKSTLLKILCGFQPPTAGHIFLEGREVVFKSVDHARGLGIDAVYQDLALINQLTVFQNMFLNREKVRWPLPLVRNGVMRKEAREHLDEMGVQIPSMDSPVAQLSGGQRQAVAVARSVFSNPKVLLLDEPLAAMGVKEGAIILDLITRLKREGNVSIILIAHNYAQVIEVCDRINMIQGGQITLDKPTSETSADELTDIVVQEYRKALEERQRSA
jgi:ABC-type sugar transport system ATPase subunit